MNITWNQPDDSILATFSVRFPMIQFGNSVYGPYIAIPGCMETSLNQSNRGLLEVPNTLTVACRFSAKTRFIGLFHVWLILLILGLPGANVEAESICSYLSLGGPGILGVLPGISSIPSAQMHVLEESFNEGIKITFGAVDIPRVGTKFSNLFVSDIHSENYLRNVPHSQVLHEFGFRFGKDAGGKPSMQPPSSIFEIFQQYELHLKNWIRRGILLENEALRPALILQKLVDGRPTLPPEFRLFSPAIDKWPGEEWTLATNIPQFSHELYYNFVGSGRMPFAMGTFFNHDLSHLSDMYQNPEIMRQYYYYGKSIAKSADKDGFRANFDDTGFSMQVNKLTLKSERRSVVYGEWFTLPDINKAHEIKALIPDYLIEDGPKNLSDAIKHIEKLPLEQRRARVQRFVHSAQDLIIRFGGGMKDVRSYYTFDAGGLGNLNRLYKILEPTSQMARLKPNFEKFPNQLALADSLSKMVDTLEHLFEFAFATPSEFEQFLVAKPEYEYAASSLAKLVTMKEKDLDEEYKKRAESAMIQLLARLETAFYQAVKLSLTPEIAYREGRLRRLSAKGRFYQYLKSFMPAESYTAYAFELER